MNDDRERLPKDTDLFSRLYALKKLLTAEEAENLEKEIQKLLKKTKFNVYQLHILPPNWIELYDAIAVF